MTMLRAGGLLDVVTPLSDCIQESVEKMERSILGVSYMYWICTTGFRVVGFLCARLISVSLFRLPRRGLPRPTALFSGYHAEGYHARTDAFKLTGYHVCRVTTPGYHAPNKLLGTGRLPHLRVDFSYFSFCRIPGTSVSPSTATTFPPSLAHTARTHSTNGTTMKHKGTQRPHTHRLTPLSSPHRGVRFDRATAVLYRLLGPAAQYPTKNVGLNRLCEE